MTETIERVIERRPFIRLTSSALAAAVAGCRPRESAAARRRTLIIATPMGEQGLVAIDSDDMRYLMFQPLLTLNDSGELEGRLADRWETSPDGREWTIHLRPGVRWHDGVPITAHDVKFTMELLSNPDADEELGHDDIESMVVLDAATIRIRFLSWRRARGALDGYEIVLPKHRLEGLDPKQYATWAFWKRPVGSGPYRFARYVPQTMIQLDANPDYYRGKPRFERVVLKFTRAGMTELLSGGVDIVLHANPARDTADAAWRVYPGIYGHQLNCILWNNAHPILHDANVRRALTLAINRRELMRTLNLPDAFPILDGRFTSRQVRRGLLPEPLPHDPERAATLLDAAGWSRVSNQGVRERDGRPFRLALLTSGEPAFTQVAVYVQEALRRVGVAIDLVPLDGGVATKRFQAGEFDAVLRPIPAGGWQRLFGAESLLGYRNARVAQLIDRLPFATSEDDEEAIDVEMTRIFQADVPATILFTRVDTTLASRRIHGLSSPWKINPIWAIDELSLDDGRH